jgi:LmbE family N-acetylglucosaminyl deacetylase
VAEKRLLAVLAHPDDESFGPGGALARAAAEGVEVHLVTMTDGAAGTTDQSLDGDELAAVRAGELRAAASKLGVTLHHLTHRDSGFSDQAAAAHPEALVNVPTEQLAEELSQLIQQIRPHVVMTHDETGGYGHRDHISCHRATVAAFGDAADWKPQRLYCEVSSERWMRIAAAIMRLVRKDPTRVGANQDIDLTKIGVPSSSITTRINIRPYWRSKKAAAACHQSQGGGPPQTRHLPVFLLRLLFPTETFTRLAPASPGVLRESSFFEGLE